MKKVLKKFNRTLSIVLAAAMVLTMVPQTAMPVLAAENEVVETQGEAPVDDITPADEDDESADVGETGETPENPPLDEPGGNDEGDVLDPSDDNETPVIDPAENPDGDPAEDPSGEEVVDPTIDPDLDPAYTINSDVTPQAGELAAPVITLKQDGNAIESGAKVPNGAANVTFEIKAADGTEGTPEFYYNIDGTANPTKENGEKYENPVSVTAPTETTEKTVTIKAIAYIPEVTGDSPVAAQTSAAATATVVFQEKGKTISLSAESEAATIKIGETTLAAETSYEIADTESDLYVEVAATGDNANRLFEVMYKDGPDTSSATWTSANEETSGDNKGKYMIPKARLTKDLVLKVVYMREIMLDWQGDANWGAIGITATATRAGSNQNKVIFGDRLKDEKPALANKILAPKDTKVTLSIYPVTGAKITLDEVTLKEGEKEAQPQTIRSNKANFTVTDSIAVDYTVTIKGTGSYQSAVLEDSEGNKVSAVSGKYSVEPRNTYKLSAEKAGGAQYDIGAVKVLEGSKDVTSDSNIVTLTDNKKTVADSEDGTDTQAEVPDGTWNLALKEGAGGKNLKVMLYANEEDAKEVGFINLTVTPVISKVTVAKAVGSDKDTITQSIGMEGHYALTLDAKEKTSTDTLTAEIKSDTNTTNFIKDAKIVDNKELVITTNAVEVTDTTVEVEIKNTDMIDTTKAVLKTIKVKPAKPAWDGKENPTVKLTSATDIVLNLDLTLPKSVDKTAPEGTKYYYKVEPKVQAATKKDGFTYLESAVFVEASEDAVTTQEALKVIDKNFGEGTDAKFDVTVQLLQYTVTSTNPDGQADDSGKPAGMDKLIASSKAVTVKNLATKAPYYADKISLKKTKEASNLYTGQTAVVATVDFGKNTTYNRDVDVKAWVDGNKENTTEDSKISVKTSATARDASGDALTVQNSQVTLVVGKNVKPGKYTVYAEQIVDKGIPENAIQAKAVLQVNVVQGIYDIEAQSVPQIYVASNKAGSAKITTVYNGGVAEKKPKTAKVDYELGTMSDDGQTFTPAASSSDLAKLVTVKNGNVTVQRGYTAGKITGDKFAVRVFANDFKGNKADDVVEFEIRTTELKLGNIVLVEKDEAVYKKLATTSAIPAEKVIHGAAEIRILKDDITKEDNFAADDFVDSDLYTLSFSKKNDIGVAADGKIWVKKPVDNVKVSATTNDGKKNKATDLTFSVTYETVKAPKLMIAAGETSLGDFEGTGSPYMKTVTAPTGAVIHVAVYDVIDDSTTKSMTGRLVDYKVSVSGAKIINDNGDKNNLDIEIVMNKKEAVLKLTDQKGKNPVEYKITNALFDGKDAPAVSLVKGEKLNAKYGNKQTLKFTVPKWNANKNGAGDGVTKIKVTAAADQASKTLYDLIEESSKEIDYTPDTAAAKEISITFKSTANIDAIKNGILRFDFVNDDGTALTKTSKDVKITTTLLKKSYKLTDKYNMSEKDAAKVKLVASGKPAGVATKPDSTELDVTFTKILNANINGEVNHFREAFALEDGVLKLVNKDKAIKDEGKSGKYKGLNNLIGFVVYTVKYEDNTSETFTTKLTINIDVAKKATINNLKTTAKSVMTAADMAPEIAVINSKKAPVNLVYAEYKDKSGTTFEVNTDVAYSNGTVILKLVQGATAPSAGKVEGTLTVIPDDSMYAAEAKEKHDAAVADSASDETKAEWTALLAKAGIELSVKIDVKAITTANKVKVESKDGKPNFKDAAVDDRAGTYTVKVPYTVVTSASVSTIEAKYKDGNKVSTPEWITFAKVSGENAVNITINKAKYVAAVNAGGKDNKGNYKLNGKVVDATAEVTYTTAEAKKDTLKFKVTPPTLTNSDLESGVTPGEETITVTVSPATKEIAKGGTQQFTATVNKGNQEVTGATVTWSVAAASDGGNMSSDTKFNANGNDADTLTVAAAETATKLTVTATYTDENSKTHTGTATVTVPQG